MSIVVSLGAYERMGKIFVAFLIHFDRLISIIVLFGVATVRGNDCSANDFFHTRGCVRACVCVCVCVCVYVLLLYLCIAHYV